MPLAKNHTLACKVWIEYKGETIIGKGGADILDAIQKEQSISKASKTLGMSYRYVWNYLKDTQKILATPLVDTYKGGKSGGGGAKLTQTGQDLLAEYRQVAGYVTNVLGGRDALSVDALTFNEPNVLLGKVTEVSEGETVRVKVEVSVPLTLTTTVTKESLDSLGLKVGDEVRAIVKSSEVTLAK